jgi:hypothetical protein
MKNYINFLISKTQQKWVKRTLVTLVLNRSLTGNEIEIVIRTSQQRKVQVQMDSPLNYNKPLNKN